MMVSFDSIESISAPWAFGSLHALAAEFAFEFPGGAIGVERFANPVERIRRDFGEPPARRRAVHPRADLHDFVADAAADLLLVMIRDGIDPTDAPGLD
jgi:hypothetical protein